MGCPESHWIQGTWWGQGAETSCSSPIHLCSRLRSQLCPVQARGCHGQLPMVPGPLAASSSPLPGTALARPGMCSTPSSVPWALRWAQNILHEQHLTLQGSLCSQQGLVAAARSPKARLSQIPAGVQAVPQPCPCLLPVPAGAAQPEPESLSHPQAGLDPGEAQLGTWSDTGQCQALSRLDLAMGLLPGSSRHRSALGEAVQVRLPRGRITWWPGGKVFSCCLCKVLPYPRAPAPLPPARDSTRRTRSLWGG